MILMGSMTAALPLPYTELMINNWEVIGQFMYPVDAYRRLLDLVRAGLIDITSIRARACSVSRTAGRDGSGGYSE
jgi:alcohol dehydrogenase